MGGSTGLREFSPRVRQHCLERLEAEGPFDLVVVGGGIAGAGVARDAALRGLSTVLLERADLAAGTSSRSSKLIHGGFRYLQQLQFSLVMEACRERALLQELAPHRVRPLPFLFPVYRDSPVRAWQVHLGLTLYDAMALGRNRERHRFLKPRELAERQPILRQEGLEGGCAYQDCVTDDALLTLDTARGAYEAGALVLPYVEVRAFRVAGGRVRGVEAVDRLSGRELGLEAEAVVNATGPWTDRTRSLLPGKSPPPLLRLTRGSHLAFPRERLPGDHAVVINRPEDGRILFVIPWRDVVLAGTTEKEHSGSPAEVRATGEEVAYILETVNRFLPGLDLQASEVLGTCAGLRPLVRQEGRSAHATSRDHRVVEGPEGLFTVAGGKLTTYRRMAREVTDRVVERLRDRPGVGKPGACLTERVPLRSCPGFGARDPHSAAYALSTGLSPEEIRELRGRHPCDWTEVLRIGASDRSLVAPLPPEEGPGSGHLKAEVALAVRHYMTLTLADLVVRRLWLALRNPPGALEALRPAAEVMAAELGWDAAEQERQIEKARREIGEAWAWQDEGARPAAESRR